MKAEPKQRTKDEAATSNDGTRDFIPTLPKEAADDMDAMLPALMEVWGLKDCDAAVLEAVRFAYREVASCLKQSA